MKSLVRKCARGQAADVHKDSRWWLCCPGFVHRCWFLKCGMEMLGLFSSVDLEAPTGHQGGREMLKYIVCCLSQHFGKEMPVSTFLWHICGPIPGLLPYKPGQSWLHLCEHSRLCSVFHMKYSNVLDYSGVDTWLFLFMTWMSVTHG